MQSEVTRFHVARLANDDVKQNYAGLFTFDPIGRIEEWRTAISIPYLKIEQVGCHREMPNALS
jgi:hypothetical protein